MKRFLIFIVSLFFVFLLTGCIGEEYDFSPPTVSLTSQEITTQEELIEANVNWDDEQYNKETDDIQLLAKEQNKIYFKSGQKVDVLFDHGDFDPKGISVSVWQNENKVDLKYQQKEQSFYLPEEKGEYMIVFDLNTDRGNAQYVGNIEIQ